MTTCPREPSCPAPAESRLTTLIQGLQYLHGVTDYGDAVEDEWLIVYMLRELTKSQPALWVRIVDADGEFLLIEAANVLPEWLSPELDQNRVWIHDGNLFIVPIKDNGAQGPQTRTISLSKAVDFLHCKSDRLIHSPSVQTEAFHRLKKYPGQIADSSHNSLVTIPRKLAYIVHSLPKSVSPAVEAFYLRDPLSLKSAISTSRSLAFPPEDVVTTSVRFSRVLFAQLRSQRFEPPPNWQQIMQEALIREDANVEKRVSRIELGMKLTCGFEMLASSATKRTEENDGKTKMVKEMAILFETLKLGSTTLPTDEEMGLWQNCHRDDDETWLEIDYRDFERELDGAPGPEGKSGFGNAQTQADLRKIVSRFEAFLNDESAGLDGAEFEDADQDRRGGDQETSESSESEDSEYEDKMVSLDDQAFSRIMREMTGMPKTGVPTTINSQEPGQAKKFEAESSVLDEHGVQIQDLAHQMEAELKHYGALTNDASLPKLAVAEGNEQAVHPEQGALSGTRGDESKDEVDVDLNLARNILESFKSQAGLAGPTGNLLGMMGFRLPRDEDEEDNEDAQ